jgi:ADP-ribose pyrophosphatase YjhB (NUDIX family)
LRKNDFCSYCGTASPQNQPFPKTCLNCKEVTYINPIPVAVGLVPIKKGLLAVRRNIEPGKGKLALPGGFIDYGESWQQAVAREIFEETGLQLNPEDFSLFNVFSPEDGRLILIFGKYKFKLEQLPDFIPNSETMELAIVTENAELVFPLHQLVLKMYFQK